MWAITHVSWCSRRLEKQATRSGLLHLDHQRRAQLSPKGLSNDEEEEGTPSLRVFKDFSRGLGGQDLCEDSRMEALDS